MNHSTVAATEYSLAITVPDVSLNTAATCSCATGALLPICLPKLSKPGENIYLETHLEAGREWGC